MARAEGWVGRPCCSVLGHGGERTGLVKGDAQVSGSNNSAPFTERIRSQKEGGADLQCGSWVQV